MLTRAQFIDELGKLFGIAERHEPVTYPERTLADHDAALRAEVERLTQERDAYYEAMMQWKSWCEQTPSADMVRQLAQAQSTIAGYRNTVDVMTRELERRTTERDTAQAEVGRLKDWGNKWGVDLDYLLNWLASEDKGIITLEEKGRTIIGLQKLGVYYLEKQEAQRGGG